MTMRLFRNRRYRLYFEFLDSFRQSRCALCFLRSETEQGLVAAFVSPDESPASRAALCSAHRRNVSGAITEATALPLIKAAVGNALRRVSHTFEPSSKWSGWLSRHGTACLLCTQVFSEENILCRALLCFLEDADFGKAFQRAPLLCLDHLQKCLAMVGKRSGFERLLDDQRAKLNGLLNDLIHFEATGKNPESWSTALEWWAGSVGPALSAAGSDVAESETTAAAASEVDFDEVTLSDHDAEKLVFENEKLKRKAQTKSSRSFRPDQ
jgi:hypothetical protein